MFVYSCVQFSEFATYCCSTQGTILIGNMEGCHKDPKYFKRPYEFYPEHFLDDNGKFIPKREGYAPFSVGELKKIVSYTTKCNYYFFQLHIIFSTIGKIYY